MQNIIANFDSLSEGRLSKFTGKWIAVLNNEIVAYGNSFKEVYEEAKRKYPNERPLIGKVPENTPVVYSLG